MHNQKIERELIMHYNLPSRRWKIRRIKTGRDKRILDLDRECDRINEMIRGLGYVPLIPPVQRGWKRSFVLRPDVMQDKHAAFYQQILDKINTTEYSSRKDFKVKKRRFGKRLYILRSQKLKEPDEYCFRRMQFSEREQLYFYKREEYHYPSKSMQVRYVFAEQWRLILKIQPNMITKTRRRDWELERRLDEINDYMDRNVLHRRLDKLRGYPSRYYYRDNKKKHPDNPLKNKPVHEIMDEYHNELFL